MTSQLLHEVKHILRGVVLISRAVVHEQITRINIRWQNLQHVSENYQSCINNQHQHGYLVENNSVETIQHNSSAAETIVNVGCAINSSSPQSQPIQHKIHNLKTSKSESEILKKVLGKETVNVFSEAKVVKAIERTQHTGGKNASSNSTKNLKHENQRSGIHQTLSEKSKQRKVPSSQISRFLSYGGLAASLGVGALAEIIRKTFGASESTNVLLTDANIERIVTTLCRMRGASLKLGQMISIQDNTFINPQIQKMFERVRQSADFMPTKQMEKVLRQELGDDWKKRFRRFEIKPFAAASIGQVHEATLLDGTDVAIKIQQTCY